VGPFEAVDSWHAEAAASGSQSSSQTTPSTGVTASSKARTSAEERILTTLPVYLRVPYSSARRSLKAFPITDTELNVMAALAIMGLSSSPNHG
jgi:hypothetical protein